MDNHRKLKKYIEFAHNHLDYLTPLLVVLLFLATLAWILAQGAENSTFISVTINAFSAVFGGILGGLIVVLYQQSKMAVLKFKEVLIYEFEESARIALAVEHKEGFSQVTNAVGFLTIKVANKDSIPEDIVIEKTDYGSCSLSLSDQCTACAVECFEPHGYKYYDYLAPHKEPKVLSEALPWTVSINVGEGIDGIKYRHVTHIPAKGSAKLLLFDLYNAVLEERSEREFYLLKIHSEYGDRFYPRICLKLLKRNLFRDKIILKVTVTGDNIREPAEAKLEITYDNNQKDYILRCEHLDFRKSFSEILQRASKYRLYPRPRGLLL